MPRAAFVVALAAVLAASVTRATPANRDDALAAEVARWSAFLRTNPASDDLWKQIKQGAEPALARTRKALDERRPLLAWLRFAPAHEGLAAGRYLGERTAGQRTSAGEFEAEWKRMGALLRPHLSPPSPDALEGVHPAFLRALGEAALPQARVYYDASLEYGRSTTPESGLYYLGAAQSARDLAELIRRLSAPAGPAAPRLRSPAGEIDALEAEMLAAYRPPLSIDRHREFIGASAALKEARELEAAGLRHGALLRYLQAALRFGSLRASAPPAPAELAKRLDEAESRLAAGVDHSLMRVFLQAGRADLDEQGPAGAANAAAVVNDVLPRYLAALGPEPPRAARSEPRVTVTLVRWPYT